MSLKYVMDCPSLYVGMYMFELTEGEGEYIIIIRLLIRMVRAVWLLAANRVKRLKLTLG